MKVLIVDDDGARSDKLRRALVENGMVADTDIRVAVCVNEAKDFLRASHFSILILDVVLPVRRDGVNASGENGLSLLSQLARSTSLKKPDKIIGITAHFDDIEGFRARFEEHASIVIQTRGAINVWAVPIFNAISYVNSSTVIRSLSSGPVMIATIHGIRTYGQWQARLHRLIDDTVGDVRVVSYKYGFFSLLAFLIPSLRGRERRRIIDHYNKMAHDCRATRILIFSHSFGTYLASELARSICHAGGVDELRLVLAGSVLDANFDWSFMKAVRGASVVNDCGARDLVLIACKVIAIGFGMAGRTGFNGFSGEIVVNRYFDGGHSLYFAGDAFMRSRWLPLIAAGGAVDAVDLRSTAILNGGALDAFARFIAKFKIAYNAAIVLGIIAMIVFSFLRFVIA
jgi:CheY-like chemotaxis protein